MPHARLMILLVLFLAPVCVLGQEKHNLAPDFLVVQYAGSIGYMSGGVGYDAFKRNARFSVHYGVVPKRVGGAVQVFAAKMTYIPVVIGLSENTSVNPLDIGLMASWHNAHHVTARWPEYQYSKGYYWWHPSLRLHLITETSFTYEFNDDNKVTSITGYIELNANDLYIVSYFYNVRSLRITDIVKTGIGIRVNF